MELSGPSFCHIRNGLPCRKWMITASERTPKGISCDVYFFVEKNDAETYLEYLRQCINIKETEQKIRSNRTFKWEKEELREFLKSIDTSILIKAAKKIKFTTEHTFYPARPQGD